jgi:putative acyl-CoA dehydrogenase
MRLCRSFDLASSQASEAARTRLLTPAVKYLICKAAPALVYEAMECLGGNGYVEEGALARLYREAPVNAIWEGSGNVMALDLLRAFSREAEASRVVIAELLVEARDLPGAQAAAHLIERTLAGTENEARARIVMEQLARLAAAAALCETAPLEVAVSYARTRLDGFRSVTYGTRPLDPAEAATLLARAWPEG